MLVVEEGFVLFLLNLLRDSKINIILKHKAKIIKILKPTFHNISHFGTYHSHLR